MYGFTCTILMWLSLPFSLVNSKKLVFMQLFFENVLHLYIHCKVLNSCELVNT